MRGHCKTNKQAGSTLVELVLGIFILGMIALSFFGLYSALVSSALTAKQKSAGSTLVTNQMEYLKSLPYNSLAVSGGSIYSANPLPSTVTKKINNHTYTIKTSINYIDDAFDGCTNYPTLALKQKYCRNYPAPSGAPAVDQNPQDYKIIHVTAYNRTNAKLAEVDTQVSARVAETASNTGSLIVNVIDSTGSPVIGATVSVNNTTVAPAVALSDTSDNAGIAIFYGLPPDTTGFDYSITTQNTNYSTLTTIPASGVLQPNYPNLNIFAQQSSYATMTIMPQATNSIALETVTTSGAPLAGVKLYTKGGYKKYTATTDTSYYYDNMTPTDVRPTTDGSGLGVLSSLVPGSYVFCGDTGATSCSVAGTTYYLAAAVPYGGSSVLSPIIVPSNSTSPPAVFSYNSANYLQKVRLILTTSSSFPRVSSMSPSEVSKSGGTIASFAFRITGANLPCNSLPASCGSVVKVTQGAQTSTASCIGDSAGLVIDCTADLSAFAVGSTAVSITANGSTLNLPDSPLLGGINVSL